MKTIPCLLALLLAALMLTETRAAAPWLAGADGDRPSTDSTATDTASAFVPAAHFTRAGVPRAMLYGTLPLSRTRIDPVRASIVGVLMAGTVVKLHMDMAAAWWPDSGGSSFDIEDDWEYVKQIDKAGHAFAANTMAYAMTEALMASGVSWEASTVWGSQLALLYQTYVEIEDGFADGWGFSLTDMASNIIGAELPVAQYFIPALQNATMKYQYVPPAWIDVPRVSTTWIDDYNSSTFWLSLNVANMVPERYSRAWPKWLALAVGYGIRSDGHEVSRRYLIALDYDLAQLLPDGPPLWNWIRQTLNIIKLPAPTLEIGSVTRLRLAFPFTIRIGSVRF